jgi:hypothetical protein
VSRRAIWKRGGGVRFFFIAEESWLGLWKLGGRLGFVQLRESEDVL